jgi:hypothetical protein
MSGLVSDYWPVRVTRPGPRGGGPPGTEGPEPLCVLRSFLLDRKE